MTSRVDIANLALLKLRSGSKITSLTDNSVPARALTIAYDICRRAELRAHNWAFALTRTKLPATTPPAWGFKAAFPLPADCLRLVQVNEFYLTPALLDYNTADASAWAIESGNILCDYNAPLSVRYVWDVQDETRYDALFVAMFAARLALEVCGQLTDSNTIKQDIKDDYKADLMIAIRAGAIEKPPALVGDDSWMMARL